MEVIVTWELVTAVLALIVSVGAVLYARLAVRAAEKGNDISRLNALLALRTHYLAMLEHQGKLTEMFNDYKLSGGLQAAQEAYASLDTKLRDVSREIDSYHASLVGRRA
jgi:hypothetical protein